MKIHYFQRYHGKENVATANTMLLLNRLYSYSPDKFFRFMKSELFLSSFEPEIKFDLQVKGEKSVADAVIEQESFKIVVETKITDWFYSDQLMKHLSIFGDEKNKALITISSELMAEDKKSKLESRLKEYNDSQKNNHNIIHINTTFEMLANAVQDVIDDRDYEMQDILDDYLEYCYNDGLIPVSDKWKYLRVKLASASMDFNIKENIYYDKAEHGFRPHDYLGLYKNKSVRAIGKIVAMITAVENDGEMNYKSEYGELTDERKKKIQRAIENGKMRGWDLQKIEHRYFFVEKFFETDFKKITPKALMGTKIFDLTQELGTDDLPNTEEIALLLKEKSWN